MYLFIKDDSKVYKTRTSAWVVGLSAGLLSKYFSMFSIYMLINHFLGILNHWQ